LNKGQGTEVKPEAAPALPANLKPETGAKKE
jgi:hypothetical protein